jgi:hypothetical protein
MRVSFSTFVVILSLFGFVRSAEAFSRPTPRPRVVCVKVGNAQRCRPRVPVPTRICTNDVRQICVWPKGDHESSLAWTVQLNNDRLIHWESSANATHYEVEVEGHGLMVHRIVDRPELTLNGMLQAGNAYRLRIKAFHQAQVVDQVATAINVPASDLMAYQ